MHCFYFKRIAKRGKLARIQRFSFKRFRFPQLGSFLTPKLHLNRFSRLPFLFLREFCQCLSGESVGEKCISYFLLDAKESTKKCGFVNFEFARAVDAFYDGNESGRHFWICRKRFFKCLDFRVNSKGWVINGKNIQREEFWGKFWFFFVFLDLFDLFASF